MSTDASAASGRSRVQLVIDADAEHIMEAAVDTIGDLHARIRALRMSTCRHSKVSFPHDSYLDPDCTACRANPDAPCPVKQCLECGARF